MGVFSSIFAADNSYCATFIVLTAPGDVMSPFQAYHRDHMCTEECSATRSPYARPRK